MKNFAIALGVGIALLDLAIATVKLTSASGLDPAQVAASPSERGSLGWSRCATPCLATDRRCLPKKPRGVRPARRSVNFGR